MTYWSYFVLLIFFIVHRNSSFNGDGATSTHIPDTYMVRIDSTGGFDNGIRPGDSDITTSSVIR